MQPEFRLPPYDKELTKVTAASPLITQCMAKRAAVTLGSFISMDERGTGPLANAPRSLSWPLPGNPVTYDNPKSNKS
jgi:hypothetical protein